MMEVGVWLAIVVALVSGIALACQVGVNSELRARMGDPIQAAVASFAIGLVGLLVLAIVRRAPLPAAAGLASGPRWIWSGGLLGAFYIVAAASLAPRLGGAGWLATVIAGQIVTALVLDHFGWLGFEVRPLGTVRVLGAGLLMIGVVMVLKR